MLVATAAVTLFVGCGEPRERAGATSSARTSPAYDALDASLAPGAATPDITLADTAAASANSLASPDAPRSTQSPSAAEQRKGGASSSNVRDALSSFELVGTGIDGTHAFAIVKTPDAGLVTVHEGGLIGRYTVRAIRADRIRLKAQNQKEATLVIGVSGTAEQASTSTTDMTPGEANAVGAFLAAGINTDQSIPKHVVYGPTARWPEGEKHIH